MGQVGSLEYKMERNFILCQSETQRFIQESRETFKGECELSWEWKGPQFWVPILIEGQWLGAGLKVELGGVKQLCASFPSTCAMPSCYQILVGKVMGLGQEWRAQAELLTSCKGSWVFSAFQWYMGISYILTVHGHSLRLHFFLSFSLTLSTYIQTPILPLDFLWIPM